MTPRGGWAKVALVCADDVLRSGYLAETLRHAGLPFQLHTKEELPEALQVTDILVLSGSVELEPQEQEAIEQHVQAGGALLCVGGTSWLDSLLGVEADDLIADLGESYLLPASPHRIAGSTQFPIHFFSGRPARVNGADVLAGVLDRHGAKLECCGVTINEAIGGPAIFIAPNVAHSVIRIQQGAYVDLDGMSAPDGTAHLADGLLRSEDGAVLDWHLDRFSESPGEPPGFLHPAADRLAEIVIRSILHCATKLGLSLPILWNYPRNAPAAGVASFSSDGSDPQIVVTILHQANMAGLRASWFVRQPGFNPDMSRVLRHRGHEISLQFDAAEAGSWSLEKLKMQETQMRRIIGAGTLTSVQTHDGLWRGRNEFFHWCNEISLRIEVGRGPDHIGNCGFLFGTCHPFRPARADGGVLTVTSLPFLVRNPGIGCSSPRCMHLIERVVAHHGVAHFAFETKAFSDQAVSAAFRNLVSHGNSQGLQWMTAHELCQWERTRRTARTDYYVEQTGLAMTIVPEEDMLEATILISGPPQQEARLNGRPTRVHATERYGFPFSALVVNLPAKRTAEISAPRDIGMAPAA